MHSVVKNVQLRVQTLQVASQQQQVDQQIEQQKVMHQQVDVMVADQQATVQHHAAEDNLQIGVNMQQTAPVIQCNLRGCLLFYLKRNKLIIKKLI